jgi:membrane fusion protein, adhesin transport system
MRILDVLGTLAMRRPLIALQPAAAAAAAGGPGTATPALRSFEVAADDILGAASRRRSRLLLRSAAAATAVLLTWAALARVDEVTRGDAKVVSSRQLQLVQSLDGGVVTAILVREGDVVEKGQLLLTIDATRAHSGARENAAQGLALQARLARLRALAEGTAFTPPPAADAAEQRLVEEERRLYETRRAELAATVSIGQQQLAQRQQELSEMRARKSAAERGLELSLQELARTRPLLASGAVSEVDIIKLERDAARARGDSEQAAAQIQRVLAAIGESQRKLQETELSFRNEARKELAESMGRLQALNESAVALNDKVDKSQIKSPVRGRVQRLLANTVGGVVQPGKDIVEIVPLDDVLVLEAKVHPRDIAFIHPGQNATVKFTAYDYSIYGGLDAQVDNISPDTVVDERGNAFYVVRVQTRKPSLGDRLPIIPGMTAEVDVLTGSKTVLAYLVKPVLKVKERALRER